jgi:hypothetical protein
MAMTKENELCKSNRDDESASELNDKWLGRATVEKNKRAQ